MLRPTFFFAGGAAVRIYVLACESGFRHACMTAGAQGGQAATNGQKGFVGMAAVAQVGLDMACAACGVRRWGRIVPL